jgi:prephenate dehydrogenase
MTEHTEETNQEKILRLEVEIREQFARLGKSDNSLIHGLPLSEAYPDKIKRLQGEMQQLLNRLNHNDRNEYEQVWEQFQNLDNESRT